MIKYEYNCKRFLYRRLLFNSLTKNDNLSVTRTTAKYNSKDPNGIKNMDADVIILTQKDLVDCSYNDYINSMICKNLGCIDNNITESVAGNIMPKIPYDLIKDSNLESIKVFSMAYMDTSGSYISKEDEDPLSAFARNKDKPDHVEVLFSISAMRSINKDNAQKIYDIYKEFIMKEFEESHLSSIDSVKVALNANKDLILENNTILLHYYFINDRLLTPISLGNLSLSEICY